MTGLLVFGLFLIVTLGGFAVFGKPALPLRAMYALFVVQCLAYLAGAVLAVWVRRRQQVAALAVRLAGLLRSYAVRAQGVGALRNQFKVRRVATAAVLANVIQLRRAAGGDATRYWPVVQRIKQAVHALGSAAVGCKAVPILVACAVPNPAARVYIDGNVGKDALKLCLIFFGQCNYKLLSFVACIGHTAYYSRCMQ